MQQTQTDDEVPIPITIRLFGIAIAIRYYATTCYQLHKMTIGKECYPWSCKHEDFFAVQEQYVRSKIGVYMACIFRYLISNKYSYLSEFRRIKLNMQTNSGQHYNLSTKPKTYNLPTLDKGLLEVWKVYGHRPQTGPKRSLAMWLFSYQLAT